MSTVVIGAGMSGLTTAHELSKANESVIVLEARDRLGGRMFTDRSFAPFLIEQGASWVHGDKVPT